MYQIYQIVYGDSLNSIANKFNTTTDNLKEINENLNISTGNFIIVPANNYENFTTYTVSSGDSLYKIATKYGINVNDLAAINGIDKNDYIYPNQRLMIPRDDVLVYVTKEYDTIDTLRNNFGGDYTDILMQNKKIYLEPDQLVVYKKDI